MTLTGFLTKLPDDRAVFSRFKPRIKRVAGSGQRAAYPGESHDGDGDDLFIGFEKPWCLTAFPELLDRPDFASTRVEITIRELP